MRRGNLLQASSRSLRSFAPAKPPQPSDRGPARQYRRSSTTSGTLEIVTEPLLRCASCVKVSKANKGKGKWNDKLCSKASKGGLKEGEYEEGTWEQLKKKTFTGKNGVSTLDAYIPENEATPWAGGTVVGSITCKNGKSAGQITGPNTSTMTVTFASCTSEGKKCTSPGEATHGDIKTNLLESELVMVGGKVAELVSAADKETGESAEFSCEGLEVKTFGSLNGLVTGDTEQFSATSVQTFSVNAKGGQNDPFTEETPEVPDFLVSKSTPPGLNLPSGENTTSTLKGENTKIV